MILSQLNRIKSGVTSFFRKTPVVKADPLNRNFSRSRKKAKIKLLKTIRTAKRQAVKGGRFVKANKLPFSVGAGGIATGAGGAVLVQRHRKKKKRR